MTDVLVCPKGCRTSKKSLNRTTLMTCHDMDGTWFFICQSCGWESGIYMKSEHPDLVTVLIDKEVGP